MLEILPFVTYDEDAETSRHRCDATKDRIQRRNNVVAHQITHRAMSLPLLDTTIINIDIV